MTKRGPSGSKADGRGPPKSSSKAGGGDGASMTAVVAPAPDGAAITVSDVGATTNNNKSPKRPTTSTGVDQQTPTRLPPSAPTSSLLPSIAMSPDPSHLLSQYSLLLQTGALHQASVNSHSAGAGFLNPFLGGRGANTATASTGTSIPNSAPAGGGNESTSNLHGGASGAAGSLLSSLAQLVATQQASAHVAAAAAAAAAAAYQGPAAPTAVSSSSAPPPHPISAAPSSHGLSSSHSSSNNLILPSGLQNWTTSQLTKQANLLNQLNQPVPQSLSLLLNEAQRRHEKKEAKRVANRRSASVSRARKKALVQEMTELNARLRRQALILALLPDLVIAVDVDGVITFCSDQVERILRYKPDVLVGSKLTDLLVPSSRDKLKKLFKELVDPEGKLDPAADAADDAENGKKRRHKVLKEISEISDSQDPPDDNKSASAPSSKRAGGVEVSDTSFPLAVVNVDVDPSSAPEKQADDNENNSDTNTSRGSKQPSSLTNSISMPRSPIAECSGNSGSDDGDAKKKGKKAAGKTLPSSDTSNTSSSMDKANANLERNVRWHNKKLKSMQNGAEGEFKDDVIGAAVTANNASARLSSLRVPAERPEASSSEEEDSGYRESNESREETSSAASDLTESNGRRKPLAPTCNVCLIRNDLTTLWCEVTSSVRTRDFEEDPDESVAPDNRKPPPSQPDASRASSVTNEAEMEAPPSKAEEKEGVKEILLCLRPIRDGEEKVDASYRFIATTKFSGKSRTAPAIAQIDPSSSSDPGPLPPGPAKRRKTAEPGASTGDSSYKRTRAESDVGMDAAIAESLMLMSSSKSS